MSHLEIDKGHIGHMAHMNIQIDLESLIKNIFEGEKSCKDTITNSLFNSNNYSNFLV